MQKQRSWRIVLTLALMLLGSWISLPAAQGSVTDRSIRYYQVQLQRSPTDAGSYYRLGDAYIQKARESGDVAYFDLAEQALRQALELAPQFSPARRHLAHALYSRHAFVEAAAEAAKAIALNPDDGHAYAVLGDAHLELGKYAQAQEAYRQMMQRQQDLYAYSRLSGFKSLHGDMDGAIADLKRALQAGQAAHLPAESVAWVQWQIGQESFALGRGPAAAAAYEQALVTYPNYHRALAGLARVRAVQQRYQEATQLYQRALAIIPLPDYAAALGDVYTKIGKAEEANKQYALVSYIGALNSFNEILYNRELALFYVDHDRDLEAALALARKEFEIRQDIYAYDLLAWALYKNNQPQEALTAMREALKLGTQDARLFFHAGMIYHRLGETAQARVYLKRALDTNPHFHLLHAEVAARTLTTLAE